jgi:hypothetical protein
MTTLLVLVVVGVLIGAFSYFTNAGFGDRRPARAPGELPSSRDIEALLAPLATHATSISAARHGHALKIAGTVEAVIEPFGDAALSSEWSACITPGDAGGTRARILVSDGSGRAQVEIPHGRIESFTRGLTGWELSGTVPAIVPGQRLAVFGVGKLRPPGYRDSAPELIVRAAYVSIYVSGEPPPSK